MQGKDDHLTVVNGSYGPGGGRILRSFLALSATHHKLVTLQHILANRNHPGFDPLPLRGVKAVAYMVLRKIEGVRNGFQTVHTAFQ